MTDINPDIDFHLIISRLGSKADAFEELCCQLAGRVVDGYLQRLRGAGGDGGIECFVDTSEGRQGWQAKYVFDLDSLITQANTSLNTAMKVHPTLTRFVLCFPFDLTGPTGRRGRSGVEKMNTWKDKGEEAARSNGRQLKIETWEGSKLRSLLIDHDASGGLRHYFFGTTSLSNDWFNEHILQAFATAGPRYTPELSVETDLNKWIAAFGREMGWGDAVVANLESTRSAAKRLEYVLRQPVDDSERDPVWPGDTLDATRALLARIQAVFVDLEYPTAMPKERYEAMVRDLTEVLAELRTVEDKLVRDIDERHGARRADSPGWRQFMAEYMVSFPAAHLDDVRELIRAIDSLAMWLRSPECALAFQHFFVLDGDPGTGKTHGVCDAAKRRHADGLRTCVVFGHDFDGQRNPWTCVSESLGLSPNLGTDHLLDCLNAAGEASGFPLLLVIDAINETKPLSYWSNHIAGMDQKVRPRPYVRLCVVCRTTYLERCMPDSGDFRVITHRGFTGIERQACQAYFQHFGLKPPIAPILQPELSNPLYLRLVCETLSNDGQDRLPPGWSGGGAAIIRDFLNQKARKFAVEFETAHSSVPTTYLMKIVGTTVESGRASLPWTVAVALVGSEVSDPDAILTWLVNEGLLIEDISPGGDWQQESVLRPAFERLGDFLIASEILKRIPASGLLDDASVAQDILHPWLKDAATIRDNQGILTEFAVIAAERTHGFELPDLVADPSNRNDLVRIAINGLSFRSPDSLTSSSARLVLDALNAEYLAYDAAETVLSCGWRQSEIDATWMHRVLADVPMATRDAFWCPYLHESFESEGVVKKLIDAVDELPLDDIEASVAERWAIELLWFTAAADRRVKDGATRAAIAILTAATSIIPEVVSKFIVINDDEVRERVLLACYGAMLVSREAPVAVETASALYRSYLGSPAKFDNAVIRDHMRCICELARELAPDGTTHIVPDEITSQPASTDWSPQLPSDEEVDEWARSLHFKPDEFHSDFFKYSMGCLHPWSHAMSKRDMGKWIAQRVARDFSFVDSQCEQYDNYMLGSYGGGRGKPVWAERIAKKYSWIALNQLASKLHDHVEFRREPWDVDGPLPRLTLPRGRNFDPTIPVRLPLEPAATTPHAWEFPKPEELNSPATSGFDEWIVDKAIPTLQEIVSPHPCGDRVRRPIVAYLNWDGAEKVPESEDLYRHMWINAQGYLVPSDQIDRVFERFHDQNLFGRLLPRAPSFLYGFAAEYPWATIFDLSEDEWQEFPELASGEPSVSVISAWNELVCEWEYDVSRSNIVVSVPAKALCDGSLWWDGSGGFADGDGTTVFVDTHVLDAGAPSLLADVEYLNDRLKGEGLAMVLIMIGGKRAQSRWIGVPSELPRCTFSQLGYLDGTREAFGELLVRSE